MVHRHENCGCRMAKGWQMKQVKWMGIMRKLVLAFVVFTNCQAIMAANTAQVTTIQTMSAQSSGAGGAGGTAEVLDPSQVFHPKIRIRDPFTAELSVTIAPGYYLYRDRLRVELIAHIADGKPGKSPTTGGKLPKAKPLLALSLPAGKSVDDPTFGKVEVYENSVTVLIDLARFQQGLSKTNPGNEALRLNLVTQGCAVAGVCYPPLSQIFVLPFKTAKAADAANNWVRPLTTTNMGFGKPAAAKSSATRIFASKPPEGK